MPTKIEIIPTIELDLEKLDQDVIKVLEKVDGFYYQITFRGKLFNLTKIESRDDFEVHSPIEYLDESCSESLDIEGLARGWENVGYSYYISPEGAYEDPDFVDLVVIVADSAHGAILNVNSIWSWSLGLATPKELLKRSVVIRST